MDFVVQKEINQQIDGNSIKDVTIFNSRQNDGTRAMKKTVKINIHSICLIYFVLTRDQRVI